MQQKKPSYARLEKAYNTLLDENIQLRMFADYVRGLKTDEDFLNLKKVIEKANNNLLPKVEEWEEVSHDD